ncbi:ABC-type transport auxiliary lipoprotein family protein [Pseudomonas sp. NY15181]|uniref:ABC-type transport auxiliary lipoprotein family protein n=1 Tax=Pseudomonas sp. NY15181 TaxID=3400349 RepID=UPI003A8BF849
MSSPHRINTYVNWQHHKPLYRRVYHKEGDRTLATLNGVLHAFQSEYQGDKPVVHIRYEARLVLPLGQRIVASRSFEVRQAVDGKQVAQVVTAFGKASDQFAAQVVEWTLQQGQV